MEKLKEGEKWLFIKLVGHADLKAFPNKKKTKPDQPDFVSSGLAVWVNKKKAEKESEGKNGSAL